MFNVTDRSHQIVFYLIENSKELTKTEIITSKDDIKGVLTEIKLAKELLIWLKVKIYIRN